MLLVDLKQLETNKQTSLLSRIDSNSASLIIFYFRFFGHICFHTQILEIEPTLYMIPDSKPFLLFTKN